MRAAGPQANALRERHSVRLARAVLTGYQAHYNMARPHQGIAQRVPADERDAHSASELLDRTLIWNQPHLLHALREFELFYNGHRPHQGIANARPLQPLPVPLVTPDQIASLDIRRRDRLGGVLHEYQHAA